MSAKDIFMKQVCPILGGVLSTAMYASPVKATYQARQANSLGVSVTNKGARQPVRRS